MRLFAFDEMGGVTAGSLGHDPRYREDAAEEQPVGREDGADLPVLTDRGDGSRQHEQTDQRVTRLICPVRLVSLIAPELRANEQHRVSLASHRPGPPPQSPHRQDQCGLLIQQGSSIAGELCVSPLRPLGRS